MRTKDELFREAQRHMWPGGASAPWTDAQRQRAAALAAHPALAAAEQARAQAGLALAHGRRPRRRHRRPPAARLEAAGQALDAAQCTAAGLHARRRAGPAATACPPAARTPACAGRRPLRAAWPRWPASCGARRSTPPARWPCAPFPSFEVQPLPRRPPSPSWAAHPVRLHGPACSSTAGSYAAKFSAQSPNLLFMGGAGLGKTHLALAVADAVLEHAVTTCCTPAAPPWPPSSGANTFDRDSEDTWLDACKEADLLILDDLGTEHITALTISVLYTS